MPVHRRTKVLLAALVVWGLLAVWPIVDRSPNPLWHQMSDVVRHGLLFLLGGAIGHALTLDDRHARARWWLLGAGVVAAVGLELVQAVQARTLMGEVVDIPAAVGGLLLGYGVVGLVARVWTDRVAQIGAGIVAWAGVVAAVVVILVGQAALITWWTCFGVDSPTLDGGASFMVDQDGRRVAGTDSVRAEGPVVTDDTAGIACGAVKADAFTMVATVASTDLGQVGPTRIVSLSDGLFADDVNLHLGHEGDAASIRIRVGEGQLVRQFVPDVFVDNELHTLVLVYDRGEMELRRDGEVVWADDLDVSLCCWTDKTLVVGDEVTGTRTFVGTIDSVAFYPRALDDEDLRGSG
ncbi:MAG: LamG domain-containing protein [Actinomycetia bacterium]|nr:LamG domain-containing protein [Actinomycetes bacterium]